MPRLKGRAGPRTPPSVVADEFIERHPDGGWWHGGIFRNDQTPAYCGALAPIKPESKPGRYVYRCILCDRRLITDTLLAI